MQWGHEHSPEAQSWHVTCPPAPLLSPTWSLEPQVKKKTWNQQQPLPLSVVSGQLARSPVLGTQITPDLRSEH